jgi:hypothetical protein
VLAAVDRGTSREVAARTYSVSVPTIKRWLKRRRETGGVDAMPIPGRPRVKGGGARRVAARAPAREPRPHAGGAPRGVRGAKRDRGLGFDRGEGDRPAARRLAAQKKSRIAQERRRGAAGPVAVAGFPLRGEEAGVRGRVGVPHLHGPPARPGSEGERAYGKVPRKRGRGLRGAGSPPPATASPRPT